MRIPEIAETVREIVHPQAQIVYDTSKPDGTPRKLLDVSRQHALGWRHRIGLREGIASAYDWFLKHYAGLQETGRLTGEEARL